MFGSDIFTTFHIISFNNFLLNFHIEILAVFLKKLILFTSFFTHESIKYCCVSFTPCKNGLYTYLIDISWLLFLSNMRRKRIELCSDLATVNCKSQINFRSQCIFEFYFLPYLKSVSLLDLNSENVFFYKSW